MTFGRVTRTNVICRRKYLAASTQQYRKLTVCFTIWGSVFNFHLLDLIHILFRLAYYLIILEIQIWSFLDNFAWVNKKFAFYLFCICITDLHLSTATPCSECSKTLMQCTFFKYGTLFPCSCPKNPLSSPLIVMFSCFRGYFQNSSSHTHTHTHTPQPFVTMFFPQHWRYFSIFEIASLVIRP